MHVKRAVPLALALFAGAAVAADERTLAVNSPSALSRLSIEELADIEISSVSRRAERLADAPAAVYVITRDEIRRAGVTTLAEALRLAPNLEVARIRSNSWAITARGFNSGSANKLLVMIDGRTVYTPLHAGVFWDVQDLVLADVERIEVVSGPGGTLWGANAFNGVINIVSRSARDTAGATVAAPVAGSEERGASLRHGFAIGDPADRGGARVYAKRYLYDGSRLADGSPVRDAWSHGQAGFRADWGPSTSAWTLQGDAYEGRGQMPAMPDSRQSGGNVLGRWSRELANGGGLQVQAHADTYDRKQPGFFTEQLDTLDIDVQHRFAWGTRHELVWGGGYRRQQDRTTGGTLLAFVPADSRLTLANLFAQDTYSISERIKLTVGTKLERNNYTGVELQPNVRLAWKLDEQSLLWGAISRALRTPSRIDRDFQLLVSLPPPYGGRLLGGPDFMSERITAYEIGWRSQPAPALAYSVNAFYNDTTRLRSVEPSGTDFVLGNGVRGHAVGLEAWGSVQLTDAWRMSAGLTLLDQHLRFAPGSRDPGSPAVGGNDPQHQLTLRSSWTSARGWSLDVGVRAIGALPDPAVPAYTALDARIGWSVRQNLELSLAGFDLLGRHAEFGAAPGRSEFGRRVLLRALWTL